jgi:3'(2'), 5'-bisphosphate nucleotidase
MKSEDYAPLLKLAVKAALRAGEEILRIYNTDFHVETKSDNTPVTLADKTSGRCITSILSQTGIPVISEEEEVLAYETRKKWESVWIVDPLDGTKEYVKRNGEFAVNIALVENEQPVIGVIYAPVFRDIYFAAKGQGSYKITQNDVIIELTKQNLPENLFSYAKRLPSQKPPATYTVVASRSHLSKEVSDRIAKLEGLYGEVQTINIGSSIKQCWVAEGKAHEYPRFGTTMEWDTAAGQCILEESGNNLIDLETNLPMRYNKERMLNSYFVALHGKSLPVSGN